MAQQLHFFMLPEDEVELFRRLEPWKADLYPELCEPGQAPAPADADAARALEQPGYYLAVGDVEAYPLKRGPNKGAWKIDEVKSPVIYFSRSLRDEEGELRAGYFWCELEAAGDWSRQGGKPDALRRLFNDLHAFLKTRYRKSKPAGFFVGPHAARAFHDEGLLLREAGRKGEPVEPYR